MIQDTKRSVMEQVRGMVAVHFFCVRDRSDHLAGSMQTFHELNGDEGDFFQIIAEIESRFNIKLDLHDLQKQTPADRPDHFLFLTAEIIGEYVWKMFFAARAR